MYALRYDGFIQSHRPFSTLEEVKEVYKKDVKNTLLYEYDCAVVELDENNKTIRVVTFEELK